MTNLIVVLTTAIIFALLLVWWRRPVFRVWIETEILHASAGTPL
jgi:hypothetical protein